MAPEEGGCGGGGGGGGMKKKLSRWSFLEVPCRPGSGAKAHILACVLCGGLPFWQSFGAGAGGAPAATTGTMVTISTVLSLVIIAFRRRCWRSRTSGAAAEHRRKRRRVPKKNKKAAVTALVVLFLAGAADRRSTLVAEAATLPTGYGAANVAATSVSLNGIGYTGTIPTQMGLMVNVLSMNMWQNKFASSIPTEMGLMTGVASEFNLYSNDLCGAIPTEVAALSSQVATWDITTDTFVGPTPCPAVSALVALYEGTGGSSDGWTVDTNWMGNDVTGDSKDPCDNSWYGVTCSSAGEVTALNLRSQGLINELPSEIGFLTALLSSNAFDVGVNQLTGQLPSEMGEWTGNSRLSTFYIEQWFDLN